MSWNGVSSGCRASTEGGDARDVRCGEAVARAAHRAATEPRDVEIDVAWLGGGTMRCTGNSFAAPHVAGIAALVLARHPELTPFQLKSVLYLTAANAGGAA